jgi:hypothetical protein
MQLGHRQPLMVALANRVDASRLQALSAVRRFQGQHMKRLKARGQPRVLVHGPLGALALAGAAHVVRTSG